jgi:hypothetical protein
MALTSRLHSTDRSRGNRQSQVLGVVCLENNPASNVFGSLRLETIEILGTQLAISLENASLYGEMARINAPTGASSPMSSWASWGATASWMWSWGIRC